MRMTIELLHLALGVASVVLLTGLAAWAYPLGRDEIWLSGGAAMLALAVDSIKPLRRARRADLGARKVVR